jgi:uncharacterized membrane protein YfcA
MFTSLNWMNTTAGFGVGVLVGLTGVGGGSLMTPIMILLFGIAPSTAVGTDLWFAAGTKIVGAWVHDRKGTIDWQILRRMFCGSLPAAALTLIWLHSTGMGPSHNQLMFKTLGATLILSSFAAVFRKRFHAWGARMRGERPIEFKSLQPALTVVAGAILGFLVTFTSIGAGALGAVMLLYLYPLRLTASSLVGTDIVHAIPLTILAGTGHLILGNVNYPLLFNLLLGSVPGIVIGALASTYAPEKVVRSAISVMLAVIGVKMVMA